MVISSIFLDNKEPLSSTYYMVGTTLRTLIYYVNWVYPCNTPVGWTILQIKKRPRLREVE